MGRMVHRRVHGPAYAGEEFPISAGDLVSALVCAVEPNLGFIAIANSTRQQGASFLIPGPGSFVSAGQQVEWIVEPTNAALPAFTPVTFYNCAAATRARCSAPYRGPA